MNIDIDNNCFIFKLFILDNIESLTVVKPFTDAFIFYGCFLFGGILLMTQSTLL